MGLTARQKQIAEIVRAEGPITGQRIADQLHVTRAALRSDLAILIMSGIIDARPKVGYYFIGRSTLGLLTEEVSDILVSDIQSMPVVILNTKARTKPSSACLWKTSDRFMWLMKKICWWVLFPVRIC